MIARLLTVAVVALVASGCGGGDSPTSPSKNIPNYTGNWTGTYSIQGCNQSGGVAAANICSSLGQTPPFSMSLTQTGSNAAGTFALGSIQFPSTGGVVGNDGSLALNATSQSNGINIVVAWNLRLSGSVMTGTISQNWTSNVLSGSAVITGQIVSATR